MPKTQNSPFPKGVRGSEMPAFTAILAWVVADYGMTPEAARTFIVGCRGTESTIEPHQWQAKVHLALERKASMGKPEHWIHDTSAIALFNHIHCELDSREVVNAGRRGIVYAALAQNPITDYLGTASDARAAFDAYIADPANGFPPPPGPIQPPPEKPADENLAAQFPRHADGKRHWPDLDLDKWYPLDIKNAIVVNQPFDTERAAYEAYPKIRQQRGHDIEFGIGTHYKLVDPAKYTMPDFDGRNGQTIPPKEGEEVSDKLHWKKIDAERKRFWTSAHGLLNLHKVEEHGVLMKDREKVIHDLLDVDSLEEIETVDIALGQLKVALEEIYPLPDATPPDESPAQAAQPPQEPATPPEKTIAEKVADLITGAFPNASKDDKAAFFKEATGFVSVATAVEKIGSATMFAHLTEAITAAKSKPAEASQPTQPEPAKAEQPADEADIVDQPPTRALATTEPIIGEIILDPKRALSAVKGRVALIEKVFNDVLIPGVDYGKIPGNDRAKPTLLKPGAENMLGTFEFYSICRPTNQAVCDWKAGFFNYEYECTIYSRITGRIEGTGIGSCNSMESKYRYRWLYDNEVKAMGISLDGLKRKEYDSRNGGKYYKYRVDNEDIFDQVNTLSKMAQKRALVAATLNATGASAVFTQDLEDFSDFGVDFGAAA